MLFLKNPPTFLFFTGKGGVGKTSLSCATAIRLVRLGKKVLLVSTDPASNVGQVSVRKSAIKSPPFLRYRAIRPGNRSATGGTRVPGAHIGPVRGALPEAVVSGIEEQLSGACTTEIAAFDEFTALLTDATLTADYDHILFDTAPTGHTIRLLQLSGAWSGFIEKNPEGASCLGPLAGLEKQRQRYAEAVKALSDPERTRLILVARAQKTTLAEVARTHQELAATGLTRQNLVINGVLSAEEAAYDALAAAIRHREQAAIAGMPAALRNLPVDQLPLKAFNMVGVEALCSLLSDQDESAPAGSGAPRQMRGPSAVVGAGGSDRGKGHGLIMMMGKGGVGKTTLAVRWRWRWPNVACPFT
jgi:arsenite efflux ATP-binding protein ArsA (TC 3.A.4.1.1)